VREKVARNEIETNDRVISLTLRSMVGQRLETLDAVSDCAGSIESIHFLENLNEVRATRASHCDSHDRPGEKAPCAVPLSCLLHRRTKNMSEPAEGMVSTPFAYNKYPSKPVTAIRTTPINRTETGLTLPVGKHYFQVPFTLRAAADYVFGHLTSPRVFA